MQAQAELNRERRGCSASSSFCSACMLFVAPTTTELQPLHFQTARPGTPEAGSFERQLHTEGEMWRYTVIRTAQSSCCVPASASSEHRPTGLTQQRTLTARQSQQESPMPLSGR